MTAVGGDDPAQVQRGAAAAAAAATSFGLRPGRVQGAAVSAQGVVPASKASTLAAQMKSLREMPPTLWVLKRTVQRL